MDRERLILRRFSDQGPESPLLTEQLKKRHVPVLDSDQKMILIEAAPHEIEALKESLDGWVLIPQTTIPRPETVQEKTRVLRKAAARKGKSALPR